MVLDGCGVYGSSEIRGVVIALLAITRSSAQAVYFAPNKSQRNVINHLTGEPLTKQRGVLVETTQITRNDILPLTRVHAETLDALIVPDGFDTAKNLSNFATKGSECQVDRDLQALALAIHRAGKPLDFMCIAPALLSEIFAFPLRITIGTDLDTADVVEKVGTEHVPCLVDDVVVDRKNKMVITPAYMLAENITQATIGIEKLIARVLVLNA